MAIGPLSGPGRPIRTGASHRGSRDTDSSLLYVLAFSPAKTHHFRYHDRLLFLIYFPHCRLTPRPSQRGMGQQSFLGELFYNRYISGTYPGFLNANYTRTQVSCMLCLGMCARRRSITQAVTRWLVGSRRVLC